MSGVGFRNVRPQEDGDENVPGLDPDPAVLGKDGGIRQGLPADLERRTDVKDGPGNVLLAQDDGNVALGKVVNVHKGEQGDDHSQRRKPCLEADLGGASLGRVLVHGGKEPVVELLGQKNLQGVGRRPHEHGKHADEQIRLDEGIVGAGKECGGSRLALLWTEARSQWNGVALAARRNRRSGRGYRREPLGRSKCDDGRCRRCEEKEIENLEVHVATGKRSGGWCLYVVAVRQ